MSSASLMVQKKMAELETELADVFSRPLDPTAEDPRRQISFDDIKQRFSFLRKLLAAEIESQPENSDELEEINQKFTRLEADFNNWNKSRSCIFDNPIDTLEVSHDCNPSSASPMVQKKMAELETELADVAADPSRQISFDDIKQRFSFLRKLLAAEVESQPETSGELEEINRKFTRLEADFNNWNKSKSCIFDNPIDTLEVCHDCTQAILHNVDDGEEDDAVGSGSEAVNDFSVQNSAPEKLLKTDEREGGERKVRKRGKYRKGVGLLKKDRRREKGERKKRKKGEYLEAFGCGIIVGAFIYSLMMNYFGSSQNGGFLLPPT